MTHPVLLPVPLFWNRRPVIRTVRTTNYSQNSLLPSHSQLQDVLKMQVATSLQCIFL